MGVNGIIIFLRSTSSFFVSPPSPITYFFYFYLKSVTLVSIFFSSLDFLDFWIEVAYLQPPPPNKENLQKIHAKWSSFVLQKIREIEIPKTIHAIRKTCICFHKFKPFTSGSAYKIWLRIFPTKPKYSIVLCSGFKSIRLPNSLTRFPWTLNFFTFLLFYEIQKQSLNKYIYDFIFSPSTQV